MMIFSADRGRIFFPQTFSVLPGAMAGRYGCMAGGMPSLTDSSPLKSDYETKKSFPAYAAIMADTTPAPGNKIKSPFFRMGHSAE